MATDAPSTCQPAERAPGRGGKRRCDDDEPQDGETRALERVSSQQRLGSLGEDRVDMTLETFQLMHPSLQASPWVGASLSTQLPSPMGSPMSSPMGSPALPASVGSDLPPVRLPSAGSRSRSPVGNPTDVTWRAWLASLLQSSSRD